MKSTFCLQQVSLKFLSNHFLQIGNWGYCSPGCKPYQDQSDKINEPDGDEDEDDDVEAAVSEKDKSYDGTILPTPEDKNNSCGFKANLGDIAGRQNATRGSYPFIAAIGIKNKRENTDAIKVIYLCVGSLINRRYVLTAAQCHTEKDHIVEVLLGAHDFETDQRCRGGGGPDAEDCREGKDYHHVLQ